MMLLTTAGFSFGSSSFSMLFTYDVTGFFRNFAKNSKI